MLESRQRSRTMVLPQKFPRLQCPQIRVALEPLYQPVHRFPDARELSTPLPLDKPRICLSRPPHHILCLFAVGDEQRWRRAEIEPAGAECCLLLAHELALVELNICARSKERVPRFRVGVQRVQGENPAVAVAQQRLAAPPALEVWEEDALHVVLHHVLPDKGQEVVRLAELDVRAGLPVAVQGRIVRAVARRGREVWPAPEVVDCAGWRHRVADTDDYAADVVGVLEAADYVHSRGEVGVAIGEIARRR